METFNVNETPCIPVTYISGESVTLTLRDTIRDAHLISKISYNKEPKILEFALYKFLMLFTQNIYRPSWLDGIVDVWEDGKFNMDTFETYVRDYEQKGFSFDLFSDIPFMLSPEKDFNKKELSPIAVLNPILKTGNNEVFWNAHKKNENDCVEDTYKFGDEDLFACVLLTSLYPLFIGQGYVASATGGSGSTPICVLYSGDNLFETLVLNYAFMTKRDYENTIPFWERTDRTMSIIDIPESYINYACIPTTKTRLVNKDGKIMVMKEGKIYKEKEKPQDLLTEYLTKREPNLITKDIIEKITDTEGNKVINSRPVPLTAHAIQRGTFLQLARLDTKKVISEAKLQIIYDKLKELRLEDKKVDITFYGQGIKTQNPGSCFIEIYETFKDIRATLLQPRVQDKARKIAEHINSVQKTLSNTYMGYINDIREKTDNGRDSKTGFNQVQELAKEFLDDIKVKFLTQYIPAIEEDRDIEDILSDITKVCEEKFTQTPVLIDDYITKGKWSNILYYKLQKLINSDERKEKEEV